MATVVLPCISAQHSIFALRRATVAMFLTFYDMFSMPERERERKREHYSIQFDVTRIVFKLSPFCLHSYAVLNKTETKSLCKQMKLTD